MGTFFWGPLSQLKERQLTLNGSTTLGLAGGATASNVLYNFTSSGKNLSTQVGNVMNGTLLLLDNTYSNYDGTLDGEIISNNDISMLSNSTINYVEFNPPAPAPEPSSLAMFGSGVLGLFLHYRWEKIAINEATTHEVVITYEGFCGCSVSP